MSELDQFTLMMHPSLSYCGLRSPGLVANVLMSPIVDRAFTEVPREGVPTMKENKLEVSLEIEPCSVYIKPLPRLADACDSLVSINGNVGLDYTIIVTTEDNVTPPLSPISDVIFSLDSLELRSSAMDATQIDVPFIWPGAEFLDESITRSNSWSSFHSELESSI